MNKPMGKANLSIISPALNDLSRLLDTYNSIAAQIHPPLEWVVIDGGSTDGTIEWLSELCSPITVKWITERDQGIYDAMNKGIRIATGEFLLFLNSGDYFEGQVLSRSYSCACFLKCHARDLFGSDKARSPRSAHLGIPLPHQAIIFPARKDLLYDLKYQLGADWDYFLRHGLDGNIPTAASSGWVRYSRGGTSDKRYMRSIFEQVKISYKYYGLLLASAAAIGSLIKLPIKIYRGIVGWKG